MGILIVDILRISAQLWMFSMHAAAMLFMCCTQVMPPISVSVRYAPTILTLPSSPAPFSEGDSGLAPRPLRLAAASHKPRPTRRGGFFHPVRNAILQECCWCHPNATTLCIAMCALCHHSLPSFVADHDFLHNFVAAISPGSKQGIRSLDADVCIQQLALEQAVFVVALVRFSCLRSLARISPAAQVNQR